MRILTHFSALLLLLAESSCTRLELAEEELSGGTRSSVNVCFNLKTIGYDGQYPMGVTRADEFPYTVRKANFYVLLDVMGDSIVNRIDRDSSDKSADPAKFDVNLKLGVHDLYFLAYSNDCDTLDEEKLRISWGKKEKLNSFWATKLHVNTDQYKADGVRQVVPVPLKVAGLMLKMDDAIPSDAGTMVISGDSISWTYDVRNDVGIPATLEHSISLKSGSGKAGQTLSTYTFVPSGGRMGSVTYTAYSSAVPASVLESHTLNDIPVACGKVTRYSGHFFGYDEGFDFGLSGAWDGYLEDKEF